MNRRILVTAIAAAVAAARIGQAHGSGKVPRIAYLGASSPVAASRWQDAFRQGLHEHGYVEAQT